MPERFRIRRVTQLRLRAHQLDEAAEARKAVGEHLGKIHELAHGARERGDIQGEREQVDQIHPALHDERAAHGDNGHTQDREEKLQRAGRKCPFPGGIPLRDLKRSLASLNLPNSTASFAKAFAVRMPESEDSISALMAAVRFFTPRETLLIFRRRVMTTISRIGRMTHTTKASRHSIVNMTASAPTIVSREIIRSSGAVVRQLRDLEQVRRQAAHELARAVVVIEFIAEALHVAEQVAADIGLNADAERVAVIGDDIIEERAHEVRRRHDAHHDEERMVGVRGQHRVDRAAGDERKMRSTAPMNSAQSMSSRNRRRCGPKYDRKNAQQAMPLIIAGIALHSGRLLSDNVLDPDAAADQDEADNALADIGQLAAEEQRHDRQAGEAA